MVDGNEARSGTSDAVRWPHPPVPSPDAWPVDPDASLGEREGIGAWLESAALRCAYFVIVRLPEPMLTALIGGLARLARRVDRRHSDAGRRFLIQAFGPDLDPAERETRLLESYRHFFRVVVESERFLLRVPFERTFDHVRVFLCDEAREIVEGGRACVMATPHVGNWELSCLFAARMGVQPLYVIGKPVKNRYLAEAMHAGRERRGIRLLARRGAMADAPRVVSAGGVVGMLLDQRANQRPVLAPFFGRPARCDRSAGVLIRRLRVPLVVASCLRDPDRPLQYEFRMDEVIQPEEVEGMGPAEVAARLNAAFERMIRRHPEQYFWLHDRYKDTPETFPEPESAPAGERESR
jgi:KDO2-lipid IV(A) lauroyltransferase